MIDEMVTLLVSEQVQEDNKKAHYVKSFDERDDEVKALTRQITGHKDLLSSSELDESVTNAIEIRQMQQEEFVTVVYRKCSRHQEVPPVDEVVASRPCEATCEHETTIQFHSCVRGGAHCWRRRRNVGSSELQDIMTKYNEVGCIDKKTCCVTPITSRWWSS